jgi:hypothetical protein
MAKTIAEESTDDIERIEPDNGEPTEVKLDLSEPDDDETDDEQDEAPKAAKDGQPREKGTGRWTEKKRERSRDHKAAKAWETEKAAYDRRIQETQAATQRQIAEMQATFTRQIAEAAAARGTQAGPQDPHEAKLAEISTALEAELKLIETDERRGYTRYNELRRQEQQVIIDKALAARDAQQRRQPQQRQDPYAGREVFIDQEYPWTRDPVIGKALNPRAVAYKSYLMSQGRPDTLDTDREALAHIQAQFGAEFGLRSPARPAQGQRDYYMSRPGPGSAPPERNGRPRSISLPRAVVDGTGLPPGALEAALREE